MNSIAFEINDLVMVRFQDEKWPGAFPSRVEDKSAGKAVLSWPADGGTRVPVSKRDRLFLSFIRADAVYRVEGIVEGTWNEPLPAIEVALSGQIERIQRREYVRVHALLPVEMTLSATGGDGAEISAIGSFSTNTIDVSGSGMALQHKQTIPLGTLFEARLSIPGQPPPLNLLAMVVRSTTIRDAQQQKIHRLGWTFVSLAENLRSRLVRYVFEMQRKSMQHGSSGLDKDGRKK
jgi:c-di-GMP-binding flagellar brake protein YcgR